MARILSTYVIREVATPTLLALLLLTFVFIVGRIYDLIDLVLQPGITLVQVLGILVYLIPSILVFVAPMAILIGVLIGVGRLTLDLETLAIRANGINLFRIYLPFLVLALLISFLIMYLTGSVVPKMVLRGLARISEMELAVATSLQPGQFHERLGSDKEDFSFYFRERDPETKQMKGVAIKIQQDFKGGELKKRLEEKKREAKVISTGAESPDSHADGAPSEQETTDSSTSPSQQAAAPSQSAEEASDEVGPAGRDQLSLDPGEIMIRDSELIFIMAEMGEIRTNLRREGDEGRKKKSTAIMLSLNNGAIHHLSPDPTDRDYISMRFKRAHKLLFKDPTIKKRNETRTNQELKEYYTENKNKKRRGAARKEFVRRYVISLAFFVFSLIGVPLAIRVRPTGKSWGILLAIGLLLVYYVLMQWGLALVEENKSLGVLLAFFPNALFAVLGVLMWWQMLRT